MTAPPIDRRRDSRASQQHQEEFDGAAALLRSRTRSQEFTVAESVAVHDGPPDLPKPIPSEDDTEPASPAWPTSVRYLVLLCAFLTSMSFGVTQVPILYVFRLMTCQAYYDERSSQPPIDAGVAGDTGASWLAVLAHPQLLADGGVNDRCSNRDIDSATALSVSLLGASTMVFGLMNLFITGSLIKRIGVKPTLLIQVFFPAVRLLIQNIGVEVWGNTGILIIQCSQIVVILGGPSGYLLALNTFVTEVVEYEGRTAALGRLTGSMMLGSATGFLLGGVIADAFGIKIPFRLTLILFLTSSAYVIIFLPHIPPADKTANTSSAKSKPQGFMGKFFGPLLVFAPQKYVRKDGSFHTEYGAFLLAWGVFLGILATGYLPTLLQLYSTDVFGFGTRRNGWLIFMFSMLRGLFLTFAFPRIIAWGRRNALNREQKNSRASASNDEREPLLESQSEEPEEETKPEQTFTFDLTYTRFSLITDGTLTLLCTFVREGWQMYLVAAVLPLASGTGSAAKGTILQMVGSSATSSERTDALAGVSLIENMARLSTTFVFGVIFAAFTKIGRTELVFTCNAALALIGFCVLILARFPPKGSRKIDRISTSPDQ